MARMARVVVDRIPRIPGTVYLFLRSLLLPSPNPFLELSIRSPDLS